MKKGPLFEKQVVEFLRTVYPYAERRVMGGKLDRGDISGIPAFTLELKATRALDLAGAMDEARKESDNAGTRWFAAIFKRRQHSVAESYVVMELSDFVEILHALKPPAAL